LKRFQNVQRIGVSKEKEGIERALVVARRSMDENNSQLSNDLHQSYNQSQQQQLISPMDQQAINERADQLHKLEV
jgi:hypothetical protein